MFHSYVSIYQRVLAFLMKFAGKSGRRPQYLDILGPWFLVHFLRSPVQLELRCWIMFDGYIQVIHHVGPSIILNPPISLRLPTFAISFMWKSTLECWKYLKQEINPAYSWLHLIAQYPRIGFCDTIFLGFPQVNIFICIYNASYPQVFWNSSWKWPEKLLWFTQ